MAKSDEGKQFFKIGEVADIVGVKPHVLRYWEGEFATLRPLKTRGAHRMYRRSDVELACLIRRLIQEEGYTLAGAKKRVRQLRGEARAGMSERVTASREVALRADLLAIRTELQKALNRLPEACRDRGRRCSHVTVTAVTPLSPMTILGDS